MLSKAYDRRPVVVGSVVVFPDVLVDTHTKVDQEFPGRSGDAQTIQDVRQELGVVAPEAAQASANRSAVQSSVSWESSSIKSSLKGNKKAVALPADAYSTRTPRHLLQGFLTLTFFFAGPLLYARG